VKGTAVETVGNVTGLSSWQQSGKEEHAAGEAELSAAKTKGLLRVVLTDLLERKIRSLAL